ncbi:hypothetical protein K466DRAFT_323436 [Polyporus arcularius HHB13444]|uniref:PHD-type domain-containing protein n=1 Tax=Polyporus arcularius HHB13444 TaxID=1314778 RepID=A0A5C3NXL7_9APHY|nr:hypothetical protein K466DRAFT_323436 [Polyporus arcularius HHB13444]
MSAAAEVIPPPEVPCFRCKKSHDNPAAFLMACCRCERAWHHTCHIPPVTEDELMRRLKADNSGKRDVGLRAWQCRTCTKKRRLEAEPSSSIPPPAQRPCVARETTQPPSDKTSKPSLESTLIEDDEDAIMILDGPPLPAPAGQLDFDSLKRLPPPPVHESRKDRASQSPPRTDTQGSKSVPSKHSAPAVVRVSVHPVSSIASTPLASFCDIFLHLSLSQTSVAEYGVTVSQTHATGRWPTSQVLGGLSRHPMSGHLLGLNPMIKSVNSLTAETVGAADRSMNECEACPGTIAVLTSALTRL